MNYSNCPRCGTNTYENLTTHSHCIGCNYFPEENLELQSWYSDEYLKPQIGRQSTSMSNPFKISMLYLKSIL